MLESWATDFRQRASWAFAHDNIEVGRAYMAWAEILQAQFDKLKGRKPQQPMLTRRMRKIQKRLDKRLYAARA